MAVWLLVMLFSAGALPSSTEAQDDFTKLPDPFKKGVELALQQLHAHSRIQQHFRFFKSLQQLDVNAGFGVSFPYHHFSLRATKCPKGTPDSTAQTCTFRNDRPLIDCVVCFKTYDGAIEAEPKPYVHCVHKPALTKDMHTERSGECQKMIYSSGSATILSVKGTE